MASTRQETGSLRIEVLPAVVRLVYRHRRHGADWGEVNEFAVDEWPCSSAADANGFNAYRAAGGGASFTAALTSVVGDVRI